MNNLLRTDSRRGTRVLHRGTLEVDLIITFILILFIYYVCAGVENHIATRMKSSLSLQSSIALKIARSYEVISLLSEKRDNEITVSRLLLTNPQNVSLRTYVGYIYGGPSNTLCVKRGVYIKDLEEVGILEVC